MSLLSQLLKNDIQHPAPANPANSANPEPQVSNISDISRGVDGETDIHGHLLALAEAEGIDARLVHEMTSADVDTCAVLPDTTLRVFLQARQDTADRDAGRLPASYTAPALCRHCGPVWLPPAHVAKAPTVGGWPRVLGCPWCHVHLPEGMALPRPKHGGRAHSRDHERHGG